MQFKSQGITKQDIGNFVVGTIITLMAIVAYGYINTVLAAQPALTADTPFVAKQKRIAQSNAIWVGQDKWARVEPVVVPLDYAGITNACPTGKGWAKVHITFSSGKKAVQWCDIRAARNSLGCFDRAEMRKQYHAPDTWLDGVSICEPGVKPLIDFATATEAQLDY